MEPGILLTPNQSREDFERAYKKLFAETIKRAEDYEIKLREKIKKETPRPRPRPSSASLQRSNLGRSHPSLAAGNGISAIRSRRPKDKKANKKVRKKNKRASRPQSAGINRRRASSKNYQNESSSRKRNHSIRRRRPYSSIGFRENVKTSSNHLASQQSQKYLKKEFQKRRIESELLLKEAKKEQYIFERSCKVKMVEATRWANYLNLGKKFEPVYESRGNRDKVDAQRRKPTFTSNQSAFCEGNLYCKVTNSEDPNEGNLISCERFLREHQKLMKQYLKNARKKRNNKSDMKLVIESYFSPSQSTLTPNLLEDRTSSRQRFQLSTPRKTPCTELELISVVEETKQLTRDLQKQIETITQNGWNLPF